MHIVVIVVTRNVSVSVKTLHSLLNFNKICIHFKHSLDIKFVNDEPSTKNAMLLKCLKHSDRLLFIEYGIFVDDNSLVAMSEKLPPGFSCVVCPCVTENVNWDLFKSKILSNSTEPVSQMGLEFDTEVSTCIPNFPDTLRVVTNTNPKCWAVDPKPLLKYLKGQKGEGIVFPTKIEDIFKKFKDRGVRICAYTDAKLVATYAHECLGNILETAGIKPGDGKGNVIA